MFIWLTIYFFVEEHTRTVSFVSQYHEEDIITTSSNEQSDDNNEPLRFKLDLNDFSD